MKIEVLLSEKEFLRFSWFDVLRHRKLWRSPMIFAAIMCVSAAVCFFMNRIRGAVVLGTVLLVAGIGIPAAYFLGFLLSLRKQAQDQKLGQGKYVYTLDIHDDGVAVNNGREHTTYSWDQVFRVYRNAAAIYLYITPQRAFLIPRDCVKDGVDSLWKLVEDKIPAERRTTM